jgi:hypothetical protein
MHETVSAYPTLASKENKHPPMANDKANDNALLFLQLLSLLTYFSCFQKQRISKTIQINNQNSIRKIQKN